MAADTGIEWTDATWNPVVGCSIVSAGCKNCYAQRMAGRLEAMGQERYRGLTQVVNGNRVWNGTVRLVPEVLETPLHWRKPRRIFVNSMSDLFHEGLSDSDILCVWSAMEQARHRGHVFQVLTKRPERMQRFVEGHREWFRRSLDGSEAENLAEFDRRHRHIWLGVSVEDQRAADERIPHLLRTPAAVRFLSCEPLLGPVDLEQALWKPCKWGHHGADERRRYGCLAENNRLNALHWVICGGESGPGARPMHPDWARSLRDQCQAAGVPYFHKQNGCWVEVPGDDRPPHPDARIVNHAGGHGYHGEGAVWMVPTSKHRAGRLLDGREHSEFPEVMA